MTSYFYGWFFAYIILMIIFSDKCKKILGIIDVVMFYKFIHYIQEDGK